MKKIISLFQRNYDGDHLVRAELVPGAEWVLQNLGVATRKFDGSCCLARDGQLFKRYEVKPGRKAPPNFEAAGPVDEVTGKQQGWVPVSGLRDEKWHTEAWSNQREFCTRFSGTTWELCGPMVNSNADKEFVEGEVGPGKHVLIAHGRYLIQNPFLNFLTTDVSKAFDQVRSFMSSYDWEGIVWWRDLEDQDCDKVKIKKKDFFRNGH